MQEMTPRQLNIAKEIEDGFYNVDKYPSEYYVCEQIKRITQFYTDNFFVNVQDKDGNTLLHYMCAAEELPQEFRNKVDRIFQGAFAYAPDPTIKNNLGQTPEDLLQATKLSVMDCPCYEPVKHCLRKYKKNYENNRLKQFANELHNTQYALFHLLKGIQALISKDCPEPTKIAHESCNTAMQLLRSRGRE